MEPPASSDPLDPYPTADFSRVVSAVRDFAHPKQIGPYTIEKVIGEGGMGTVYRAEQTAPIHRTVALKVIKLGMDTREVIVRFESERQALALMDHPNLARVLDAGATETGRPYFVMEYVEGESITAFADHQQLSIRQRLELFTQACDAVQHAHQKAIIHRDLKPSNILVTNQDGKPWVKVIDFGVAKALDHRLTEKTYFTETGQLVGTPEYMAPEQAILMDVDTRSDVYSLGVVLYELLSGALPFDPKTLRSVGYHEIQRIIRDVDPPRPSTRLSRLGRIGAAEVARLRQIDLSVLEKELRRELEWIPLKAMRKERDFRYSSATELAEDVGNYLTDRPLRAGPETALYRARKFLRRNKATVAAAAAMVVLLILGIAATTGQSIRARRAERIAQSERQQAIDASDNLREVNQFLTQDLLASASPEISRGKELTVREAVDRAAESVADRFKTRPQTEVQIQNVLSDTYDALGLTERALEHARAALSLEQKLHGPDETETLKAMQVVGSILAKLNHSDEAEPMLRDSLARARQHLPADHEVTISGISELANGLRRQGKYAEAESLYRETLAADIRKYGENSVEVANSLNSLAVLFSELERDDEAEPLYRKALEIRGAALGKDHPTYLTAMANLARLLERRGKREEALTMMQHVLDEERRILKDDHPSTMLTIHNLAIMYYQLGQIETAEKLYREAIDRRTRVLGPEDRDTLQSISNYGVFLSRRERYAEAESYLKRAIAGRRKVLGPTHTHTIGTISALISMYEATNRPADAEPYLEALTAPEALATMSPTVQAEVRARLGICLVALKRYIEAEALLSNAEQVLRDAKQTNSTAMRRLVSAMAVLDQQTGRPVQAIYWRLRSSALDAATRPSTAPTTKP